MAAIALGNASRSKLRTKQHGDGQKNYGAKRHLSLMNANVLRRRYKRSIHLHRALAGHS
jgi:hypothetical protein